MQKFNHRGCTSLMLCVSFLIVVVSGFVLWIAHPPLWGLDKGAWKHMHIFMSLLMVVAGVVHLCFNWAMLRSYLWQKTTGFSRKRETALALVLPAAIVCTAIFGTHGDMSRIAAMNVSQVAQQAGCSVEQVIAVLKKGGIAVDDPAHTLLEVAKDNNVSPMAVLDIVWQELAHGPRGPHGGER